MSFTYYSESLTDIHQVLVDTLLNDFDFESSPRGRPIRELVNASFTLGNPRNRLIESKARNVNYGFAVGEFCWYVRGDSDLETMLYYNKRMSQFSDDGSTINSAYGARMFLPRWGTLGQIDNVINELKHDPDSRRAVMHINEPNDLLRATVLGSKDVPCTLSVQFLIRDRRLHMIVNMRSNDVIWGLPYDVFSFTCLQELIALQLKCEGAQVDDVGEYHHNAGSLHLYDTHFTMAGEVSGEDLVVPAQMDTFTIDDIEWLAYEAEPLIRKSTDGPPDMTSIHTPAPMGKTLSWMTEQLERHRQKRLDERLKREQREKSLDELVKLTDELGLYDTNKENDEQT